MIKLLQELIVTFVGFALFLIAEQFFCRLPWKIEIYHQAVHSADTDVNAIIMLESICDL